MKTTKSKLSGIVLVTLNICLFIAIILFLLLGSGCHHKYSDKDFLGAEYASAPAGFHLISNDFSLSPSSVNFVTQKVTFSARFSDKVSWKITITGRGSGARKYLEGLSDQLDPSQVLWDGSASNLKFFQAGEICDVVLSFMGTELVFNGTVTILQAKRYEGVLISDFEGGGILNDPTWWYYYTDTLKPANTLEITSKGIKSAPLKAVQGTNYLNQAGEDLDSDWFIGGLGYWYDANLNDKLVAMSSDPGEIYLNAFVSGNQNTTVSFSIFESGTARDIFYKNVPLKSEDWELVSMKLSTFSRNATSTGDGVMELNKLKFMEIVPAPSVLGAKCEMNIDYIIFTKGQPFRP